MKKYEDKELKRFEEIAVEITKEEIEYLKKKRIQLMFMYIMAVVLIIVFYFSTKITNETIKLIFGIFSVLPSLALICIAYLQREKYDFLYRKEVVSK